MPPFRFAPVGIDYYSLGEVSNDCEAFQLNWYYQIMGQEFGPVSSDQLKALASNRTIAEDSQIRKSDTTNWVTADRVKGLLSDHRSSIEKPPPVQVATPEIRDGNTPLLNRRRVAASKNPDADRSKRQIKGWHLVGASCLSLIFGFFAGREYLKWEIRSSFSAAGKAFSDGMSKAFSDNEPKPTLMKSEAEKSVPLYTVGKLHTTETFSVTLVGVRRDKIQRKGAFGTHISDEDYLICDLKVSNPHARKILNFREGNSLSRGNFRLYDDVENDFMNIGGGFGDDIIGQISIIDDINPGESRNHIEAFKLPPANTPFLILNLNLACVGGDGWIQYKIPYKSP